MINPRAKYWLLLSLLVILVGRLDASHDDAAPSNNGKSNGNRFESSGSLPRNNFKASNDASVVDLANLTTAAVTGKASADNLRLALDRENESYKAQRGTILQGGLAAKVFAKIAGDGDEYALDVLLDYYAKNSYGSQNFDAVASTAFKRHPKLIPKFIKNLGDGVNKMAGVALPNPGGVASVCKTDAKLALEALKTISDPKKDKKSVEALSDFVSTLEAVAVNLEKKGKTLPANSFFSKENFDSGANDIRSTLVELKAFQATLK